jgi:hypothetical protein
MPLRQMTIPELPLQKELRLLTTTVKECSIQVKHTKPFYPYFYADGFYRNSDFSEIFSFGETPVKSLC